MTHRWIARKFLPSASRYHATTDGVTTLCKARLDLRMWTDAPLAYAPKRGEVCDRCADALKIPRVIDLAQVDADPRFTTRLYLIRVADYQFVKIGITTNVAQRLGEISAYNPLPVELLFLSDATTPHHAKRIEGAVHITYRHLRHDRGGREWFVLSDEESTAVARQISAMVHESRK